jgi:hypothetical protein
MVMSVCNLRIPISLVPRDRSSSRLVSSFSAVIGFEWSCALGNCAKSGVSATTRNRYAPPNLYLLFNCCRYWRVDGYAIN